MIPFTSGAWWLTDGEPLQPYLTAMSEVWNHFPACNGPQVHENRRIDVLRDIPTVAIAEKKVHPVGMEATEGPPTKGQRKKVGAYSDIRNAPSRGQRADAANRIKAKANPPEGLLCRLSFRGPFADKKGC